MRFCLCNFRLRFAIAHIYTESKHLTASFSFASWLGYLPNPSRCLSPRSRQETAVKEAGTPDGHAFAISPYFNANNITPPQTLPLHSTKLILTFFTPPLLRPPLFKLTLLANLFILFLSGLLSTTRNQQYQHLLP